MNNVPEPSISQLRDIVVPAIETTIPWFAIGLALIAILLPIALLRFFRNRRYPWRDSALQELQQLKENTTEAMAFETNALLRRIGLALSDNPQCKTLQGQAWISELNRVFRTDFFASAQGQQILDQVYLANPKEIPQSSLNTLYRLLKSRTRWPW